MTHPPLLVQSGDDTYRHFQLEQEGWGIVATVESQSDFERFPFMLAASAEMLEFCYEMVQYLELKLDGWRRVDHLPEDHAIVFTAVRYLEKCQALIRKAEGRLEVPVRIYFIRDEHRPVHGRQCLTLWSGAFASDYEGAAVELSKHGGFCVTVDSEKLRVECESPRTEANYIAVDAAINAAIAKHNRKAVMA